MRFTLTNVEGVVGLFTLHNGHANKDRCMLDPWEESIHPGTGHAHGKAVSAGLASFSGALPGANPTDRLVTSPGARGKRLAPGLFKFIDS